MVEGVPSRQIWKVEKEYYESVVIILTKAQKKKSSATGVPKQSPIQVFTTFTLPLPLPSPNCQTNTFVYMETHPPYIIQP
jgi:hypothetical protein